MIVENIQEIQIKQRWGRIFLTVAHMSIVSSRLHYSFYYRKHHWLNGDMCILNQVLCPPVPCIRRRKAGIRLACLLVTSATEMQAEQYCAVDSGSNGGRITGTSCVMLRSDDEKIFFCVIVSCGDMCPINAGESHVVSRVLSLLSMFRSKRLDDYEDKLIIF